MLAHFVTFENSNLWWIKTKIKSKQIIKNYIDRRKVNKGFLAHFLKHLLHKGQTIWSDSRQRTNTKIKRCMVKYGYRNFNNFVKKHHFSDLVWKCSVVSLYSYRHIRHRICDINQKTGSSRESWRTEAGHSLEGFFAEWLWWVWWFNWHS